MAETSGPFDGASLVEADWDLMMQTLVDGVHGAPGSTLLNASISGSTLRGVDLTAGTASCRGHWYRNSAVLTKASGTNGSGSARIDRAVLQLDRSGNAVTIEVVAGTAGSGQPPALTDTATLTQRPLWKWTVAPSATAVTALTDERQWAGTITRPCTSTNRPYAPTAGQLAFETDTGRLIRWDGTAWGLFVEDTGFVNLTLNAAFDLGSVPLQVAVINGICHLSGSVVLKTLTQTSSLGFRIGNLPAGMLPRKTTMVLIYQDGGVILAGNAYGSGSTAGQLWITGNLSNVAKTTMRMTASWPV